ncbi:6233_t:CDS:2 [Ambispora leptoticha]|uniref:protein-tyrosine-phosphatase n=1 Tax=Ambispora leptoticha TaxID=144679 RepID=A0A9N9ALA9_9GLOM|nr:6233_t:CDS:2 [Ambispora leptoticha]
MNSPTTSSHQVHPEPISVEHDGAPEKNNGGGGFFDSTLKMAGYRKRRFGKIPEPVIIPPPNPSITTSSPVSPAKSDSCLDLPSSSPRTPSSPTKRFVLKPINALAAALQRTSLTGLTGRNKSATTLKVPKSPQSPKGNHSSSPLSSFGKIISPGSPTNKSSPQLSKPPKSPRILHRKGSGSSLKKSGLDSPTRSVTDSILAPIKDINNNSSTAAQQQNSGGNGNVTSGSNSKSFFFQKSPFNLSINTSQTSAPKSPSKLSKFNLRTQKSAHGSSCRKAMPISPLELGEKLPHKISPKPILIDVRNLALYQDAHIRDSFNVNLPTLLIKRYRRGNVSNFSLDNFITTPEGRDKYLDIIQEDGGKNAHDVIVFDETMDESDKDSPGWTLLSVLERAMLTSLDSTSSENVNESCELLKGRVYWLKGGFEAFKNWDKEKIFVTDGLELESWPLASCSSSIKTQDQNSCSNIPTHNNNTENASSFNDYEIFGNGEGAPNLVRRDSLFSVNTERSSLRRKLSDQKEIQKQPSIEENHNNEHQSQPLSLQPTTDYHHNYNDQQQQQSQKSSPKQPSDIIKSRRASNGLQYLFGPSGGSSRNVGECPPTPSDPNRQRYSLFDDDNYNVDPNECSPNTPTSPSQVTHPETVFIVSTILSDFLFLGPEITKQEEVDELKEKGVKRILNMAYECEDVLGLNRQFESYLKLNIKDSVEEDVESGLKIAIDFIDKAQKDNASVYVHCKAGKSRSVTAVLAYLIKSRRWTLKDAYDYVMKRRRGICPNIGFVAELMRLEENVLGVRRSNFNSATSSSSSPSSKNQEYEMERRGRDDSTIINSSNEGTQPPIKLPKTAFF